MKSQNIYMFIVTFNNFSAISWNWSW